MSVYDHEGLPRFVEPEYGVDNASPSVKEAELDPCCTRCTGEWRYPGFFSLEEGPRVIDIPASFGPTSWTARLVKFVIMCWCCGSLIYKWYDRREYPAFFLAFLTHWSMIFACLWLILSLFNSIVPPAQPARPNDSVGWRVKISWLLFELACHFTMITVILYWSLDYKPGETDITYINLFNHLFVLVVWPEGLVVNRIPVRWKHLPFHMFMASCYIAWLAIHQLATDIGVPNRSDNDPDTNDDLLYTAVDFENKTVFSTILVVLVVFVAIPTIHSLLWALSLYSWPCNYSGRNRRYVSKASSPDQSATDNGNVYDP